MVNITSPEKDPELKNYPVIRKRLLQPAEQVHLE